jgi:hypothetical protein
VTSVTVGGVRDLGARPASPDECDREQQAGEKRHPYYLLAGAGAAGNRRSLAEIDLRRGGYGGFVLHRERGLRSRTSSP